MKKIISSLVLIAVLLSACFIGAMPASAAAINYDDFDIYDGILVEYLGDGGDVVIPSVDADGNPVTEIDSRAFHNNEDITSVVIPEGIVKMGSEVFEGCTYLEKATLPFSLTECGFSTFRMCSALSEIVVPSSLKEIPQDFCSGCKALTDITISYGVETIGVFAFQGITAEKVVIPKSVTAIYAYAFANIYSEKMAIYISNPMCDLGFQNGYDGKGYTFVFSSPDHIQTPMTIYAPTGSPALTSIESNAKGLSYIRVMPTEQSVFDAMEENQKDYGMQAPVQVDDPTGTPVEDGNKGTGDKEDKDDKDDGDLGNMLLIIGIAFAALILILIIVVVIVVVVKNNKKKKKAAAKAARRAAKAAAAAQATEAVAEEAPAEEAPADDAE